MKRIIMALFVMAILAVSIGTVIAGEQVKIVKFHGKEGGCVYMEIWKLVARPTLDTPCPEGSNVYADDPNYCIMMDLMGNSCDASVFQGLKTKLMATPPSPAAFK